MIDFVDPKKINISEGRWSVVITVIDSEGKEHKFVASADSYYTSNSGIFFGTKQEYDEYD